MLRRLETALDRDNLAQNIVFLSRAKSPRTHLNPAEATISFVVGFNGSAHSQAALDLALCVAHQTRLVKANPVLVHVVYVVDATRPKAIADADRILWQARCLASEWRGALHAHLRVGSVAGELSQVAQEVEADLLLLGCYTANHRLVNQLAEHTPCSVVGLPR
ncbi:MAG TPA: universal stress protein [Leptolyngbyaceae cyanobacterium M65_K2018_010]|nr:universal stress protein [Leptolyngbyaceae cyanobacterium M65_K2018_010]